MGIEMGSIDIPVGETGNIEKTCVECDNSFLLTQGEVTYYVMRGLVTPKRCRLCRAERKNSSAVDKPEVEDQPSIISIVCDHCGRDAEVPFQPFANRTVYCKVCWVGIKNLGGKTYSQN
tara:strand:+ start:175 stop:531 length:357 start_codon:yes stop_codon:yes gene_type:complete